jgi:DNA polymerase-3 subunit delta
MSIALIVGAEEFLASRAITSLSKEFLSAHKNDSPEEISLDAGEFEFGQISESLAPSLFGGAKVLTIKNLQDLTGEIQEELLSHIDDIDENTFIILWHKGGVKGKATLEKIKKVADREITVEALKKESEKIDFLSQEFKSLGRKVEAPALVALVEALGGDIAELASGASQLASDTPKNEVITVDEVNKYYRGRVETSGFDVADAVMAREQSQAITTFRQAINTGVDPIAIISAISSSLRTLAKVANSPRGAKSFELAGSLGLAPWQIDKARRQLGNWNPGLLAQATILVSQVDADIKGASAEPMFNLEKAILQITAR